MRKIKRVKHTQKEHKFLYSIILFIVLLIVIQFFAVSSIRKYSKDQIVNEVVAAANYNRLTILTLHKSIDTIEEMLIEQLDSVANMFVTSSSYDNITRNELLKNSYAVDEVNWISSEGIIIYSSKNYEGRLLPQDHAAWKVINGETDRYVEGIRQDIYSDDYYFLVYLKADDNSVVQVSMLANKIAELTRDFSYSDFLSNSLDEETVLFATVYISSTTYTDALFFSSVDDVILSAEQLSLIQSKQSIQRETTFEDKEVLEVYIPLEDDIGDFLGTYFLVHPLEKYDETARNINIFITFTLTLLFIIFSTILYNSYKYVKKTEASLYIDAESGLYNSRFIKDYYDKITENTQTPATAVVVLLITNYRRIKLLHSHDDMTKRMTNFVKALNKYSEANESYRYSEDMFFMLSHMRNHDDVVESINQVMNSELDDLEIKAAVITNDGQVFSELNAMFNVFETTGMMLRDPAIKDRLIMNSDIFDEIIQRQILERDLRLLSIHGFGEQMHVVFQPQIDAATQRVVGFETLLRWNHPEYGYISPLLIFEIAENNDCHITLTRWIATKAFEFVNKLKENGLDDFIVSINVSVSYIIKNEFIHNTSSLMEHYGIESRHFGIEITETAIDESTDLLSKRISTLSDMGITVYIDDYGKGYSSLLRLKELDINVLKIDKAFIDDIQTDNRIVRSTIEMAKTLNLVTIAEGVETLEQYLWLRDNDCTIIQGFFFSKPLLEDDALRFILEAQKEKP